MFGSNRDLPVCYHIVIQKDSIYITKYWIRGVIIGKFKKIYLYILHIQNIGSLYFMNFQSDYVFYILYFNWFHLDIILIDIHISKLSPPPFFFYRKSMTTFTLQWAFHLLYKGYLFCCCYTFVYTWNTPIICAISNKNNKNWCKGVLRDGRVRSYWNVPGYLLFLFFTH